MWRYFSYANTHRYLDVLDELVTGYNHTYHRSIKTLPAAVNVRNAHVIWDRLYPERQSKVTFKFKVGDRVRITKKKGVFDKGYTERWTEEIFKIKRRIARRPPVYTITEYDGTPITGTFYEQELQKVTTDELFRVEKVLKRRGRNRRTRQVLVKWKGYPSKYNSWIRESDLQSLRPNKR